MAELVNLRTIRKRAKRREDTARANRKQLVGLFTDDPHEILVEGAQLVETIEAAPPMAMVGHVTSSYYSPNVGRSIALAMVKRGRERTGETLFVPRLDGGRAVRVTVTEPVFYDKEGVRARG